MSDTAPTKDELRAAEMMAERELLSIVREVVARSGLDRQEIARRMGVHKSGVSKVLNSPRNLTAKVAARLVRAAGERLFFSAAPVSQHGDSQADGYAAMGAVVLMPRKITTSTINEGTRAPVSGEVLTAVPRAETFVA